jgi:hypothetical protein
MHHSARLPLCTIPPNSSVWYLQAIVKKTLARKLSRVRVALMLQSIAAALADMTIASTDSSAVFSSKRNPLQEVGVLQNVLTSVGPGHWFYLAAVCRLWRDLYAQLPPAEVAAYAREGLKDRISCDAYMTLYSAVFTSPARVSLALAAGGIDSTAWSFNFAAGRHSSAALLAAAQQQGIGFTSATTTGAASSSRQFATLQFLRAQGCPWHSGACHCAAKAGTLQTLQWLREQGCEWDARCILQSAVSSGSTELAAWVMAQPGVERTEWALLEAVRRGDTPMCQFLHAEQCLPWNERTTSAAATHNQIDTLDWLREQGCPWSVDKLCAAAAERGAVEVLEHLQQHDGVRFTPEQLR